MSGDNMLGDQPLKFYSEDITETKIHLVNHLLIMNAQKNKLTNFDRKSKKSRNEIARNRNQ